MSKNRKWKVIRRTAQRTSHTGSVHYRAEVVAGPFESEEDAFQWIKQYRGVKLDLSVKPIKVSRDISA